MKARDAMHIRTDTRPELALDVRLMNITSALMFTAVAVLCVVMLLWWAVRHPAFAITGISVHGDIRHNNEVTLRANVVPRLQGSFFTVD